jgi:hypothetical protein
MAQRVLEWYNGEADYEVRLLLLEHMAAFAHREPRYEQMATTFFETAPLKSDLRIRLEAAAIGTPFYQKLRRIELVEEERSLFGEPSNGKRPIEQHFHGPVGAVTGTGNITADAVTAINNVENPELKALLERVLAELSKHEESPEKAEAAAALAEVAKEPSRSKLDRVIRAMKKVGRGVSAIHKVASGVADVIGDLEGFDAFG